MVTISLALCCGGHHIHITKNGMLKLVIILKEQTVLLEAAGLLANASEQSNSAEFCFVEGPIAVTVCFGSLQAAQLTCSENFWDTAAGKILTANVEV